MADTQRTEVNGLQVATILYDFINDLVLPGTDVDQETYWKGFAEVITDLGPKNKALLAERDELQAKIDAYHAAAPGEITDFPAYKQFLTEVGYLAEVPADFQIGTDNVDREISETAGPQLVVPILNARFALNASNARWGSLYDALYDMLPSEQVERRIASGEIEIAPIAFMRGRTLADAFVILDEAQNTTPAQMKMFLTRFGQNTRMVICGDPNQTDLPGGVAASGLADATFRLEGVEGISLCRFTAADVVRHPIVGRIVEAYEGKDA